MKIENCMLLCISLIACSVVLSAPAFASVTDASMLAGATNGATISVTFAGSDNSWPNVVTFNIKDTSSKVVRSIHLYVSSNGLYSIPWDGKDNGGAYVPAGDYTVSILDASGTDLKDCSGHINNLDPTLMADTTKPVTTIHVTGAAGDNNWYTSDVGVTLIAVDNNGGSDVANVIYRVDADASHVSTGDLATTTIQNGDHTIYYWSTDNNGNVEDVKSTTINVDTTTPSITWSANVSPNPYGWYNHDVLISFTPHAGISGIRSSTASQVLTSSGKATGTVTDNAGRTASVTTDQVNIDNGSPSTTVSTPMGNNGWYIGPLTISAQDNAGGSDIACVNYTLDNGAAQSVVGAIATITPSDGAHTLTYWCMDKAGNIEAPHSKTFSIDANAPVTVATVSPPPNVNGWCTSNVLVTLGATDASTGVDHTEYSIGGTSSWTTGTSFSISSDGQTPVYYRSVDKAGNVEAAKSIMIRLDKVSPSISWAANGLPNVNGWYNHDVLIQFTPYVGVSGVQSITPDQTMVSSGQWTGSVTDNAGRTATTTTSMIYVDKSAPTITSKLSSQPNANGWCNVSVNVNFTATDALSGISSINGNTTLTGEGTGQRVTGSATDRAGNTITTEVNGINIDKTAPSATLTITPSPNSLGWYLSNADVKIDATDDRSGIDGIWYSLDGHSWTSYTNDLTLGDGIHTLLYRTMDKAGNVASYSKTIEVTTAIPSSNISIAGTTGSNGWYKSNLTVTINSWTGAAGLDHAEYSYDGSHWFYGSTYDINTDGRNMSYYRSVDNAGNVEQQKILYVSIDTSPPTDTFTLDGHIGRSGWYDSDVKVTLYPEDSLSGVNKTEYSIDGKSWYNYTGTFTAGLDVRKWIYYRSTDNAGNVGSGSIFINFPPQSIDYLAVIGGLFGVPTATPVPTPTPAPAAPGSTVTPVPGAATSTPVPGTGSTSDNGTSPAIYIGAIAILGIAAGSIYYLFRKK